MRTNSLGDEAKEILLLSWPLMLAQGGMMGMGVVDTIVVGRTGALEMAAVSLGNSIAGLMQGFGIGLGMGVEPLVGQAYGAGQGRAARRWLWQGIWLIVFVAVPLMFATYFASYAFGPLGISEGIGSRTTAYLISRLPSVALLGLVAVQRSYLTNLGRPRPALVAVVLANVANLILDLVFVLGWFGVPSYGAVGAGWVTSVCSLLIGLVLAYAIYKVPLASPQKDEPPIRALDPVKVRRVLTIGWPIGAHLGWEIGVFTAVSALIARFGEVQLAGHQIAIALAAFTFMCAVGLANATTARVGYHVGSQSVQGARRAGLLGLGLGSLFSGAIGLVFITFPEALAHAFTTDPEVAAVGAKLVWIGGIFSLSDGVQAIAAGALRGAGDTQWPFYTNFVSHWIFGLPLGMVLAHTFDLGPSGFWWGLVLSLTLVAGVLSLRFWVITARPIRRLDDSGGPI